jgi:hypothetical protein
MTQMDATFTDHNAKNKAQDRIVDFSQKHHLINNFFNNFELLANEAGIVTNKTLLNHYLKKNVKQTIIDQIVHDRDISGYTYPQFKTEILCIGRLHKACEQCVCTWN